MFVFLIIIVRTSLLKEREKTPYILLGWISGGRYTLQGRSMTITNLNVCVDTSIGFLFGRLVSLGLVGSLTVAIIVTAGRDVRRSDDSNKYKGVWQ